MILASIFVFVAVWLWVGGTRSVTELGETPAVAPLRPGLWGGLAVAGAVLVALAGGGPRLAAWCVVGLVVAGVAGFVVHRRVQRRRRQQARHTVTRAATVMAGLLRAGLVPDSAMRLAAEECPVLRDAVGALDVGGDPTQAMRQAAAVPGHEGLMTLARAWEVCSTSGAAVAPVIDRVSESMRTDQRVQATVASELAAPRATGHLMALLPLVGVAMGVAVGGDPIAFLTGSTLGMACLVGGVILAGAGVVWTERLAAE